MSEFYAEIVETFGLPDEIQLVRCRAAGAADKCLWIMVPYPFEPDPDGLYSFEVEDTFATQKSKQFEPGVVILFDVRTTQDR